MTNSFATATAGFTKPNNPCFSSGPCAKRPNYSVAALDVSQLGRSHRSSGGKAMLNKVGTEVKRLLGLPDDYLVGIMAGSDTGAVEAALWNLLGNRPVDVLAWEAFSKDWVTDVVKELKIADARSISAPYGQLPDLTQVNFDHDVVFVGNGTTSGVMLPNEDWIDANRQGLTICDATSLIFSRPIDWQKLDVITFSWQKVLGGEGAHGVLILSPRAVQRLESYTPSWPMPKIFRLSKGGKLAAGIFKGETINTPSMLCVADCLDALAWVESLGGANALYARTRANAAAVYAHADQSPVFAALAEQTNTRSLTSVCLKIVEPRFAALSPDQQADVCKQASSLLDKANVAYDINGYRDAPAGLRIWCGGTVETTDLIALCPWLDAAVLHVLNTLTPAENA